MAAQTWMVKSILAGYRVERRPPLGPIVRRGCHNTGRVFRPAGFGSANGYGILMVSSSRFASLDDGSKASAR